MNAAAIAAAARVCRRNRLIEAQEADDEADVDDCLARAVES